MREVSRNLFGSDAEAPEFHDRAHRNARAHDDGLAAEDAVVADDVAVIVFDRHGAEAFPPARWGIPAPGRGARPLPGGIDRPRPARRWALVRRTHRVAEVLRLDRAG